MNNIYIQIIVQIVVKKNSLSGIIRVIEAIGFCLFNKGGNSILIQALVDK